MFGPQFSGVPAECCKTAGSWRVGQHPPTERGGPLRSLIHEGRPRSVTTVLVLVILALVWAAVLVPPFLQGRREHRPSESIASFRQQLHVLERTTPGAARTSPARLDVGHYDNQSYDRRSNVSQLAHRSSGSPSGQRRRSDARRHRRDVFVYLLAAVGVTFLLALVVGGLAWTLNFVVAGLFLAYVGLLVSLQQQSMERDEKVRYIAPPTPRVEEPADLRRYGN